MKKIPAIIIAFLLIGVLIPTIKFTGMAYSKYRSFLEIGRNSTVEMGKKFITSEQLGIFEATIDISPEQWWYRQGFIQFIIFNKSNEYDVDVKDILKKASKIIIRLNPKNNSYVQTKLYLKEQNQKIKFIGFGKGKKTVSQNTVFFSTSAGKKSDYITYNPGVNNITIELHKIKIKDFDAISAFIYLSLNSQSAVPYLFLFQAFACWLVASFLIFLLIKYSGVRDAKKQEKIS